MNSEIKLGKQDQILKFLTTADLFSYDLTMYEYVDL